MQDLRCEKCNKLLGKYYECKKLEIKCPRCGANNYLQDNLPCTDQVNKSQEYHPILLASSI